MARILGINYTQDAGIAIIDTQADSLIGVRKERLNRVKHSWGNTGDFKNFYSALPELSEQHFDLVVESFSSDPIRQKKRQLRRDLLGCIRFSNNIPRVVEISHHVAHLYSAFPLMKTSKAAGAVIDCMGSYREWADQCPIKNYKTTKNEVEISSFYTITSQGNFEVIGKQFWDGNWRKPVGLGAFYYLLTKCFYHEDGDEGKVMALASYGNPQEVDLPPLQVRDNFQVFIPEEWFAAFDNTGRFRFSKGHGTRLEDVYVKSGKTPDLRKGAPGFQQHADFAACGQKVFQNAVVKIFEWLINATRCKEILYSGGIGLNCVANGILARSFPEHDFKIPGHPDDGGTAIGAAIWGVKYLSLLPDLPQPKLDYLGRLHPEDDNRNPDCGYHKTLYAPTERDQLVKAIVNLLQEGWVIGLYQKNAEYGPRALGNRTLLGDPRDGAVRDFINSHIKDREWYRPVAPVVIENRALEYFEFDRRSEFMQFAVKVREEKRSLIPAVTHYDGTARLQTLSEMDNPFLFRVLEAFAERTGIPILINTSFNLKGQPIVETPEEAMQTFSSTEMHALVVNSTLYKKDTAGIKKVKKFSKDLL